MFSLLILTIGCFCSLTLSAPAPDRQGRLLIGYKVEDSHSHFESGKAGEDVKGRYTWFVGDKMYRVDYRANSEGYQPVITIKSKEEGMKAEEAPMEEQPQEGEPAASDLAALPGSESALLDGVVLDAPVQPEPISEQQDPVQAQLDDRPAEARSGLDLTSQQVQVADEQPKVEMPVEEGQQAASDSAAVQEDVKEEVSVMEASVNPEQDSVSVVSAGEELQSDGLVSQDMQNMPSVPSEMKDADKAEEDPKVASSDDAVVQDVVMDSNQEPLPQPVQADEASSVDRSEPVVIVVEDEPDKALPAEESEQQAAYGALIAPQQDQEVQLASFEDDDDDVVIEAANLSDEIAPETVLPNKNYLDQLYLYEQQFKDQQYQQPYRPQGDRYDEDYLLRLYEYELHRQAQNQQYGLDSPYFYPYDYPYSGQADYVMAPYYPWRQWEEEDDEEYGNYDDYYPYYKDF